MNYNKYKSGAGLDIVALEELFKLLEKNRKNEINILEFGSGFSTQFLVDYKLYSNKNISIDTYDNDAKYAFNNKNNYSFVNVNICPLISTNSCNFEKQLYEKKYDRNLFQIHKSLPYGHPKFWRQRNCFYDLDEEKLKGNYDLVIIDGPNGNGRNISFLYIQNRVSSGSIIFLDDYDGRDGNFDYDFEKNLTNILNVKEIFSHNGSGGFEKGGKFKIFEVL